MTRAPDAVEALSFAVDSMAMRRIELWMLVLLLAAFATTRSTAQRRARAEPPVPYDAAVEWTAFVSAFGDRSAQRSAIGSAGAALDVPIEGWQCTYSAPVRARLNGTNWSEVRTLECTSAEAVVSTTGFCQIAGSSWGARAAVLSLGRSGSSARVQITLDCSLPGR